MLVCIENQLTGKLFELTCDKNRLWHFHVIFNFDFSWHEKYFNPIYFHLQIKIMFCHQKNNWILYLVNTSYIGLKIQFPFWDLICFPKSLCLVKRWLGFILHSMTMIYHLNNNLLNNFLYLYPSNVLYFHFIPMILLIKNVS